MRNAVIITNYDGEKGYVEETLLEALRFKGKTYLISHWDRPEPEEDKFFEFYYRENIGILQIRLKMAYVVVENDSTQSEVKARVITNKPLLKIRKKSVLF